MSANLAAVATVSMCKQGEASPHSDGGHYGPGEQRHMEGVVLTRCQTNSVVEEQYSRFKRGGRLYIENNPIFTGRQPNPLNTVQCAILQCW